MPAGYFLQSCLIRRPQRCGQGQGLPELQLRTQAVLPHVHRLLCLQRSGLSEWLGDKLTPLQHVPPAATVVILCLLIAIFTECTSNVATTTLFLPILASMVSGHRSFLQAVLLPALYPSLARVAGLNLLHGEKPRFPFSPGVELLGPKAFWPLSHLFRVTSLFEYPSGAGWRPHPPPHPIPCSGHSRSDGGKIAPWSVPSPLLLRRVPTAFDDTS